MKKSNPLNYISNEILNELIDVSNINIDILEVHLKPIPKVGIYFLYKNTEIVYLGKSKDIEKRIIEHIYMLKKDFDSYSYLEVGNDKIDFYERFFLNKFLPKYNKDTVTNILKNKQHGKF